MIEQRMMEMRIAPGHKGAEKKTKRSENKSNSFIRGVLKLGPGELSGGLGLWAHHTKHVLKGATQRNKTNRSTSESNE